MLCDDFPYHRGLLHHPMQREAEEGADRYKGEAEGGGESVHLEIDKKSKLVNLYTLLMKLWRERWKCERAKVNYCKRKITSRQLVDAMNHEEKEESEISDKIVEIDKELGEFYK